MNGVKLAVIGPATLAIATPAIARNEVRVAITCKADGALESVTTAGGIVSGVPLDDRAIQRALPDKRAAIVITNDVATPYRCVGGFIFTLQRLRYRHIGFISEPPSPER